MELAIPLRNLDLYVGPRAPQHIGKPDSSNATTVEIFADMELAGLPLLTVEVNYRPGDPGVHTLSNGDPGYPAESPELDILRVTCKRTLVWTTEGIVLTIDADTDITHLFTGAKREWLESECIDAAEKQIEDDAGEAAIDAYLANKEFAVGW